MVIDEIQRRPELFEILRVLIDRPEATTRFLILGSASPSLVKGVSESLAGRVGFLDLGGFDLRETGSASQDRLWLRGGFPRSFLAPDDAASFGWRQDFLRTLLERDIPQLGISIPAETLRRFWTMIAHYHGQIWIVLVETVWVLENSYKLHKSAIVRVLEHMTGNDAFELEDPGQCNFALKLFRKSNADFSDCLILAD